MNYIIYEISLLAEHFGINAKPVIAIPHVHQFSKNELTNEYEFSTEVKAAYRRGVYLLGMECFTKDNLGKPILLNNGKRGFKIPLPSTYTTNCGWGNGRTGWEVVQGDIAGFSNGYMYISQPGTVKVRYVNNGYLTTKRMDLPYAVKYKKRKH